VLLVPEAAQFAVGVGELRQGRLFGRRPERLRPIPAGAVVGGQAVGGDGAQPAAEGAGTLALEAGQLADEDAHDFLGDVLGVGAQRRVLLEPVADERPDRSSSRRHADSSGAVRSRSSRLADVSTMAPSHAE
jgi:hypothetical protein